MTMSKFFKDMIIDSYCFVENTKPKRFDCGGSSLFMNVMIAMKFSRWFFFSMKYVSSKTGMIFAASLLRLWFPTVCHQVVPDPS